MSIEKVRPAVEIDLGGRKRHLKLDLNAMCEFQEATGKNLFETEVIQSLSKDIVPADLRALVWACLLHEDDSLTIKEVGSWITIENMLYVANDIARTSQAAIPEAEDENHDPLQKSPPG